ncbi:MAG: alpha/beta fold hydrolase, partial [Salinibacterium sp.]|nr:alpha/beta fold hydrolase [Salinibacterium sp.]
MASLELVLLHALPLDGSMWAAQQDLLPGATHSPTLYALGDTLSAWATAVLDSAQGDRLIVVGNSVGGSCALEMAVAAPGRIAGLVLIGTKAAHRPDPGLQARVLRALREQGVAAAWHGFWEPLFSRSADRRLVAEAKRIASSRTAD